MNDCNITRLSQPSAVKCDICGLDFLSSQKEVRKAARGEEWKHIKKKTYTHTHQVVFTPAIQTVYTSIEPKGIKSVGRFCTLKSSSPLWNLLHSFMTESTPWIRGAALWLRRRCTKLQVIFRGWVNVIDLLRANPVKRPKQTIALETFWLPCTSPFCPRLQLKT